MNLILFETAAEAASLASDDPRAAHIRGVLRMGVGATLFVGVVNGPRGKAIIARDDASGMALEIEWEKTVEPPRPFFALAGLPRPQTARDLLREGACFGLSALHFFAADKGEPSYVQSTLWSGGEWARRLREGAEQAFATSVPEVARHSSLAEAVEKMSALAPPGAARIALDIYEAGAPLSALAPAAGPVMLALGAERGWSAGERATLRGAGFALAHLGPRVLRTETALVAAMSVLLARRGEF